MAKNTINIEFNQSIVTVATIVAPVVAGYLSYATGIAKGVAPQRVGRVRRAH